MRDFIHNTQAELGNARPRVQPIVALHRVFAQAQFPFLRIPMADGSCEAAMAHLERAAMVHLRIRCSASRVVTPLEDLSLCGVALSPPASLVPREKQQSSLTPSKKLPKP